MFKRIQSQLKAIDFKTLWQSSSNIKLNSRPDVTKFYFCKFYLLNAKPTKGAVLTVFELQSAILIFYTFKDKELGY